MSDPVQIRVIKKAADPLGIVRVSLGSGQMPEGAFVYCVYRGTKEEARDCLRVALGGLEALIDALGDREPDIQPDDGKQYA